MCLISRACRQTSAARQTLTGQSKPGQAHVLPTDEQIESNQMKSLLTGIFTIAMALGAMAEVPSLINYQGAER